MNENHIKVLRRGIIECNLFGEFDKKYQANMNGAESKCARRQDRHATAHRADWCREAPQSTPHAARPAALTTLGNPPSTTNSTYCTFRKRYANEIANKENKVMNCGKRMLGHLIQV